MCGVDFYNRLQSGGSFPAGDLYSAGEGYLQESQRRKNNNLNSTSSLTLSLPERYPRYWLSGIIDYHIHGHSPAGSKDTVRITMKSLSADNCYVFLHL